MGKNYFTEAQIKELQENQYIEKVTDKSIKYSIEFKIEFWKQYENSVTPSQILLSMNINPKILGHKRIDNIVQRIKKESQELNGFSDKRTDNSGRPRTRNMTPEEQIAYLKHQVKYQKQQIEALKKMKFVSKKYQ